MNKIYSIKEMYYTLQGEGAQAGRPAVFLRFAGCNLWSGREEHRVAAVCKFCDTQFVGTDGPGGGKGLGVVPDPIGQSIPIGSKNVRNPHEQGVLSVLSDQKGEKGAYGGPEAPEGESYKGDL